ncbi:hypothetical protein R1flu_026531 [Riccia fluitans]|uniref:Uncharacterized protein n=1 Tax=Riccia fluitans TaxID=41844 RepID=A0ABD1XG65_9MARC
MTATHAGPRFRRYIQQDLQQGGLCDRIPTRTCSGAVERVVDAQAGLENLSVSLSPCLKTSRIIRLLNYFLIHRRWCSDSAKRIHHPTLSSPDMRPESVQH